MSEVEFAANAPLAGRMVSTTLLNRANTDDEVSCRPTILLYDPSKKGSKKCEETVHIPTNMELASAMVSELEQQQAPYQQQPQPAVIFTSSGGKSCSSRIHIKRTECTSAVVEPVSSLEKDFHVVKIQISPNFKSSDSNGNDGSSSSSTNAAIDNKTIDISHKNTVAASGDDQRLEKTIFHEYQHPNIQISESNQRSSTVLIRGDLHLDLENAKSLNSAKVCSDLASDLSKVQYPSKVPKVSIVSFISDDNESICANSDRVKEDQGAWSVKSDNSKKNISQTFLSASSEEISISVQDSELSSSKPVTLTISSDRSASNANTEELFPELNPSILARPVSASSPVPSAWPLEISVSVKETRQNSEEAASSEPSLPSASYSAEAAIECSEKAIQVQATRVIVDKSDSSAATITLNEMVQKPSGDLEVSNPTYLYYMMTSGQCSPSDTLDSGTCSDMENGGSHSNSTAESLTPPPLPKKMGPKLKMMHLKSGSIISEDNSSDDQGEPATPTTNAHARTGSFTDSDESECSLSCDSLNSSEFARSSTSVPSPPHPPMMSTKETIAAAISMLPDSLLRDIRDRKFASNKETTPELLSDEFSNDLKIDVDNLRERNRSCVLITQESLDDLEKRTCTFETDKFYKFHINEKDEEDDYVNSEPRIFRDDETFAGYKDIHSGTSTIRSSKGTVRGVKNRVRNGIATFLQMQQTNVKNYKEKDSGKVVLYTTSMGIIRETYAKCANVKQILRTLLIKFEERDVFMSMEYQQEIKERMQMDEIQVPQLFVEGQYIGDAATVERLNESGELRQMLKPYKSMTSSYTCQVCGGYRLLPCPSCNGSKKSVHRNHFTTEFVALKCMNCDEVGLVKCHNC